MNPVTHLNPGIVATVAWLNDHGFETRDSGDGKTHDFACDRDVPYVVIRVALQRRLTEEADRLYELLRQHGIDIGPIGHDGVYIQASYDPLDGTCIIDLVGLDDALLRSAVAP